MMMLWNLLLTANLEKLLCVEVIREIRSNYYNI